MAVLLSPTDITPVEATRGIDRGQLRRIARGVVTDELAGTIESVVLAHLYELVARLLPGAVVTDRSAVVGGPIHTDGGLVLHVAHPTRRRDLQLPGLTVAVRSGPGPVEGDQVFHHDQLHLASQARVLVDNARLSRTGADGVARTLDRVELEDRIEHWASVYDEARLARLRGDVERVGELLAEQDLAAHVTELLGAAQGTRPDVELSGAALTARRDGVPVDRRRLAKFDALLARLQQRAPSPLPTTAAGAPRRAVLPFFEAYFSNFIEGTEFEIDEAARIVFDGEVPPARPEDAHDILGTYRVVADEILMASPPADGEQLLVTLQRVHTTIMGLRPEAHPGRFKVIANRVGAYSFVQPTEVIGTLHAGWKRVRLLDDPFARAVLAMYVISEVHPFDDGNGRVARVLMNMELAAAHQSRVVIPTVSRLDYLASLRAMSANDAPDALISVLGFAQRWTSRVDWGSVAAATAALDQTNALQDAGLAEREGLRLVLPA